MTEKTEAKWYVLHTFTGYEAMVKDSLEKLIENNNLQEYIFEIQVPMEQTIEEKANGKKKIVMRKLFPCYVFVKMAYDNELWFPITNTRGVTGFVGPGGRPLPLTDEEVRRMRLEKHKAEDVKVAVGDEIKVVEGALKDFAGVVTEVNSAANKVRAKVSMFGRDTEVDLDFEQIEVLNA